MREKEEGFLTNRAPQNSASKNLCSEDFIPCGSRDKTKAMSSTQKLPNLKGSTYEFPVMGQCKSYMCSVGIVFLILIFLCVFVLHCHQEPVSSAFQHRLKTSCYAEILQALVNLTVMTEESSLRNWAVTGLSVSPASKWSLVDHFVPC